MEKDLLETLEINHRLNIYLLDAVKEEHLNDQLTSKGRNVGEQFAHIHNVRLMWLKAAAPTLLEGLDKVEKEKGITKAQLKKSLNQSAKAMLELLKLGLKEGKIKGFKPHPSAFVGYLISHEAHHRSQIILCLKQSGHPVDKKISYGIWEWGSR